MAIKGALPQIGIIPRHCETFRPNNTCQYLRYGCRGCEAERHPENKIRHEKERIQNKLLALPETADQIDYLAYCASLSRKAFLEKEAERSYRNTDYVALHLGLVR